MAAIFLSNPNTFLPSTSTTIFAQRNNGRGVHIATVCKAGSELPFCPPILTKRGLTISFTTTLFLSLVGNLDANAAILEADDDLELLEKVKKDRKKRIERQGVLSSSNKETEYLQDAIYKLSKVGQAIENNDLPSASSVLGPNTDSEWVKNTNTALNKLSSSPEEKSQVDAFNSSLSSLIVSVTNNDMEASKLAFVGSASAFEKWTILTGLVGQLKGL